MPTYTIHPQHSVGFIHGQPFATPLRDYDQPAADTPYNQHRLELISHIRSGDYFALLATQLDSLSAALPAGSAEQTQIEQLVSDLLYIDRTHHLIRK